MLLMLLVLSKSETDIARIIIVEYVHVSVQIVLRLRHLWLPHHKMHNVLVLNQQPTILDVMMRVVIMLDVLIGFCEQTMKRLLRSITKSKNSPVVPLFLYERLVQLKPVLFHYRAEEIL